MAAFIVSGNNVGIVLFNRPYTLSMNDPRYKYLHKAMQQRASEQVMLDIINSKTDVPSYVLAQGVPGVEYNNGNVYVNGKVLHESIVDRVRDFAKADLPLNNILSFIGNLEENPSFNSRKQLYNFLQHKDLVITDDGHFLAYKSVQSNYMDWHSGTIFNGPGARPKMDRRLIDDNPKSHCSKGLHVGALGYAKSFHGGGTIVIVKVNPRDVVSVPDDHSCQKCRVCEYLVLSDMESKMQGALYTGDGKPYEVEKPKDFSFADNKYDDGDRWDEGEVYDASEDDFIIPELEKIDL